jgi:hypothetical protein
MSAIAPGIRVLAAVRAGAVVVGRPRGVVHIYSGPLTRSGASAPTGAAPFCGTRSRRLRVLGKADDLSSFPGTGRRFCRSCTRRLPAALGVDGRRVLGDQREDWMAAFADLTVSDLHTAAGWCRTVSETHQVGRLLQMLHGPKPVRPRDVAGRALQAAHELVEKRRRILTTAERPAEEREGIVARRAAETAAHVRQQREHRRGYAAARAAERAALGKYLAPHERELLATGT